MDENKSEQTTFLEEYRESFKLFYDIFSLSSRHERYSYVKNIMTRDDAVECIESILLHAHVEAMSLQLISHAAAKSNVRFDYEIQQKLRLTREIISLFKTLHKILPRKGKVKKSSEV